MSEAVDNPNPILIVLIPVLFLVVGVVLITLLERRDRRNRGAEVLALWEALALARHDLRLEVNERGARTLHGTVKGLRYSLGLVDIAYGYNGILGVQARVQRASAPRLVVWPSTEPPAWAPKLPVQIKTDHDEFDQIFTVFTDDAALAQRTLGAEMRTALLSIGGAGLVCDDGKLTLVTGLDERQVDAELIDSVRVVVGTLCAEPEAPPPQA